MYNITIEHTHLFAIDVCNIDVENRFPTNGEPLKRHTSVTFIIGNWLFVRKLSTYRAVRQVGLVSNKLSVVGGDSTRVPVTVVIRHTLQWLWYVG